jgi:hypothetical protein
MTMANAPLWDGTVSDILLIWVREERKYFCKWGWTGFTDLPVRQNQIETLDEFCGTEFYCDASTGGR